MIAPDRISSLAAGDRVSRLVYVDPAVFDREMVRIFADSWVFAGLESEVPHPGDFKTDHIGKKPVILVRGNDNRVRLLYNVCRHRGAKVCYENYGQTKHFRCMYHGWAYDTAGTLAGIPLRERFQHDDAGEQLDLIAAARVETYRGFIFATANPEAPPIETYLGRGMHYLDQMCERAPAGEIEVTRPIKCEYAGNWKLAVENYTDNYHPSVLHQSALEVGIKLNSDKYGTAAFSMKNAAPHTPKEPSDWVMESKISAARAARCG